MIAADGDVIKGVFSGNNVTFTINDTAGWTGTISSSLNSGKAGFGDWNATVHTVWESLRITNNV